MFLDHYKTMYVYDNRVTIWLASECVGRISAADPEFFRKVTWWVEFKSPPDEDANAYKFIINGFGEDEQ